MKLNTIINPATKAVQYYCINIPKYLNVNILCVTSSGLLSTYFYNKDIIGIIHRNDGPAIIYPHGNFMYFLNGKGFHTKEEWFDALMPEEKYEALWNINGN